MRRMRGSRRVVHEERLLGHERLLLTHPVDRAVGHVLGEVVALLGRPVWLHRHFVLVDRRRILVGLPTEEAVEVLESASAGQASNGPIGLVSQTGTSWHFPNCAVE